MREPVYVDWNPARRHAPEACARCEFHIFTLTETWSSTSQKRVLLWCLLFYQWYKPVCLYRKELNLWLWRFHSSSIPFIIRTHPFQKHIYSNYWILPLPHFQLLLRWRFLTSGFSQNKPKKTKQYGFKWQFQFTTTWPSLLPKIVLIKVIAEIREHGSKATTRQETQPDYLTGCKQANTEWPNPPSPSPETELSVLVRYFVRDGLLLIN